MNKIYQVVIIEDNIDFANTLKELVELEDQYYVSGVFNNAESALSFINKDNADIVLMDIDLPGIDGIECTKRLRKINKNALIIVVTIFENSSTVLNALKAGAVGYLTKNIKREQLTAALSEAVNGGAPMSMNIARMVVNSFRQSVTSPLTTRETEILSLLSQGKSYQSIADLLIVSKETIKSHIKNIYVKLQVQSKEEAIHLANKNKLI
jgi:DNA-binding NarL/FixJ family response regulator